jgi:sugar lactone lactonase YvrE
MRHALLLPFLFLPLPLAPGQGVLPPATTGDLLVASSARGRLLRLTHAGHQLADLPFSALAGPHGIAVGKDGSVYLVSSGTNEVLVLDRKLALVRRFSTATHATTPAGIAIGPNGNLFVAGSFSNAIAQFMPDGTHVRNHVGHGVSGPTGIAIASDGSFFVTSTGSGQVQKFDTAGNLSLAFSGFGLANPQGAALWNNELFVTGANSNNIAVFSLTGSPLRELRHAEIAAPQGLAFTSDGRLAVASASTNRISWFRPDGSWLATVTPPGSSGPTGLAFLPGVSIGSTGSPRLGVPYPFGVFSPHEPGTVYVTMLALSASPPITLPDGRVLALAPDVLLVLSLSGIPWFSNFVGVLDPTGVGLPAMHFPVDPILTGLRIHGAAVTIDPAYPTGIAQVSPTVSWVLSR